MRAYLFRGGVYEWYNGKVLLEEYKIHRASLFLRLIKVQARASSYICLVSNLLQFLALESVLHHFFLTCLLVTCRQEILIGKRICDGRILPYLKL